MKTLEELLNFAYEFQSAAISGSSPHEVSMPYFIGENSEGELFVCAIASWDGESKNKIMANIRQHFREVGVVQYVTASEAWKTSHPKDVDLSEIGRPSEDPRREDCLICGAAHKDGRKLVKFARIVVADDNKRHIEPLEEELGSLGGSMLSLLE